MKSLSPHKGIVGAYDLFECEASSDLVLEKAAGGEVFDILLDRQTNGVMTERRASQWVREILEAIAHCHSRGIVHLVRRSTPVLTRVHVIFCDCAWLKRAAAHRRT